MPALLSNLLDLPSEAWCMMECQPGSEPSLTDWLTGLHPPQISSAPTTYRDLTTNIYMRQHNNNTIFTHSLSLFLSRLGSLLMKYPPPSSLPPPSYHENRDMRVPVLARTEPISKFNQYGREDVWDSSGESTYDDLIDDERLGGHQLIMILLTSDRNTKTEHW